MTDTQRARPRHLAAEYAAQFGDVEVAAAYRHRPPYPPEAFTILDPLLGPLIREYSTNRDYVPYDIVVELTARGLTTVAGQALTETMAYRQPVDGYVESFHSRNGFSRARLSAGHAREFDDQLKALLGRHRVYETVRLPVRARVVWVRPVAT